MDFKIAKNSLRIFAVVMSVLVIALIFSVAALSLNHTKLDVVCEAVDGKTDIEGYTLAENPIFLSGEWEVYPGVYVSGETADMSLLRDGQTIHIPIGSLTEAQGIATYRLTVKGDPGTDTALYLPNLKHPMNVYLNGVLQLPLGNGEARRDEITFNAIFPFSDATPQENEIIISTNGGEKDSAMYKRYVVLGTLDDLFALSKENMANTTFVLGILGLILLNGFVFIAMRPNHKLITCLTLFDAMLILRIVFGLPELSGFMNIIFGNYFFTDSDRLSLQIFFLMITGFVGCLLAANLFDPEKKVPRFLTAPLPVLYLVLAVVMPLNIPFFEQYGIPIILAVYVFTFGVVFLQIRVCWKRSADGYSAFQFFKTTYIGVVVFFDILLMNTKTHYLIFTYAYIIFFLLHLFVRLYDSNMSYRDVARLNQNLEKTVEERTAELQKTNRFLQELSTQDFLTGTHNRLYMEQVMEDALATPEAAGYRIYLCMFDLDYFKRINDIYGHDAGDEQLKCVVDRVTNMILPGAVLARVGGEEFLILYRDEDGENVLKNVEAIRKAIEADAKVNPKHTTASFGVGNYCCGMSQKELLKLADRCLYKAKNTGRNRVVVN